MRCARPKLIRQFINVFISVRCLLDLILILATNLETTGQKKGEESNDSSPQHLKRGDAYCRIVVSVQFGDVYSGTPVALNRITPDGSEQKPRCPVVPVVIGVAVTT